MGRTGALFSLGVIGFVVGCGASSSLPAAAKIKSEPSAGSVERREGPVPQAEEKSDPALAVSPAGTHFGKESPVASPLPSGTKVLQVGDSFAGALGLPLGRLLKSEGVSSTLKHTDASYLTDWAWDGNLQKYLWRYNPDLIVITLGANELEISDPEARAKTIKKLVSLVGERPCVWVAIPLWAGPKNGLLEIIANNVAPCVYLDTNRLMDVAAMPRIRDGIHPTEGAREDWAKVVFEWLRRHRKEEAGRPWSLQPD